jgi:hypothetical protein
LLSTPSLTGAHTQPDARRSTAVHRSAHFVPTVGRTLAIPILGRLHTTNITHPLMDEVEKSRNGAQSGNKLPKRIQMQKSFKDWDSAEPSL